MSQKNAIKKENTMTYKELEIGDLFTICRENNTTIYKKYEFYFVNASNPKLSYRKLNGCTKVVKVK